MIFFQETSIGKIGIAEKDGCITHLYLPTDNVPQDMELDETPLLRQAFTQHNWILQVVKKAVPSL